jgi:2-aminoethylphosphonate dioxygenase
MPSETIEENLFQLSKEQKEFYLREGYLLIEDFFSKRESAHLASLCDELAAWPETSGKYMKYHENNVITGERQLCRIENFTPYSQDLNNYARSEKLLKLLEDLTDKPYVLFKEKINYKLPGGGAFPPHQDAPAYTQFGQTSHLTIMFSIDASSIANGCLECVPKSHKHGVFPQEKDCTISREWCSKHAWVPLECDAGSILIFGSYLAHKSEPNKTEGSRRIFYLTYNARSDGDKRDQYYEDKRKLFPPKAEREPGKDYSVGADIYNLGTPIID